MNTIGNKKIHLIKKYVSNERGDLSILTLFMILAVNMIVAFVLLYATVKINSINIRNAIKMELNNTSAKIYSDTFHSQREVNLDSYMDDIQISNTYTKALISDFKSSLASQMPLNTTSYSISNIDLGFNQLPGEITYFFSCDLEFYIRMFGKDYPSIKHHVVLTGSHNTKF